jgi:hypothetical protein
MERDAVRQTLIATDTHQAADENMPVTIIACQVLKGLLEPVLPTDLRGRAGFQDYGYHRVPGKMTQMLQEVIDGIEEPSLVVLGYGLCGNGLDGIKAGVHTLLAPRVNDCIALLLGSRQAYLRQFSAVPGTYYLSEGWLESGSHPLSEYEEYAEKYGPEDAMWILDQQYQNYERVALVAPSQADLERNRPAAHEVARFCERWDMVYEEIVGSDDYLQRLVEMANALRQNGSETPEWTAGDFLVVPPGGEIRQRAFLEGT